MTRWPSLRAALDDLAGKHPVEQAKALMSRGVDWSIGEQSREAELARYMSNYGEILDRTAKQFRGSPAAPATGGNAGGYDVTRSASAHPYSTFAEGRQEPGEATGASVAASAEPVGPTAREGIAEAKRAAAMHWANKRRVA